MRVSDGETSPPGGGVDGRGPVAVRALATTFDGRTFFSGDDDGALREWRRRPTAAGGTQWGVASTLAAGGEGAAPLVSVSADGDGRTVVGASCFDDEV